MAEVLNTGHYVLPEDMISAYVTNSGSNDMGVDGSETPVVFSIAPAENKSLLLTRMLFYMESGENFSTTNFMHLPALENGVVIESAGSEITTWKDNIDILTEMFDIASPGPENRCFAGRWTFTRDTFRYCLWIKGGETFNVVINDDLSADGIIFRVKVKGIQVEA